MCKSLNLRQSITDGGIYTPTCVNYMKENRSQKNPGLNYFSDIRKLQKNRSIRLGCLENKDWAKFYHDGTILEEIKDIDLLVLKHINAFWKFSNLELSINIEHKI